VNKPEFKELEAVYSRIDCIQQSRKRRFPPGVTFNIPLVFRKRTLPIGTKLKFTCPKISKRISLVKDSMVAMSRLGVKADILQLEKEDKAQIETFARK
jgi:hypothetical protein